MKKIFIEIIDTNNGIVQYGKFEEPVTEGLELHNALSRFGLIESNIEWLYNKNGLYVGKVTGTFKIIHATIL